jgi:DNA-binding response OmpR family regulator
MKRPSILLVEDDDDVGATVADILLSAGYDVDLARNGVEGLWSLRHGRRLPRLILLDWSMPVMSAPDMFAAMQSQPAWRDLPVVLLTAHDDAKSKALALRASGYLKKPVDADDLLRMVSSLVREHATLWLRRTASERDQMESATGTDPVMRGR